MRFNFHLRLWFTLSPFGLFFLRIIGVCGSATAIIGLFRFYLHCFRVCRIPVALLLAVSGRRGLAVGIPCLLSLGHYPVLLFYVTVIEKSTVRGDRFFFSFRLEGWSWRLHLILGYWRLAERNLRFVILDIDARIGEKFRWRDFRRISVGQLADGNIGLTLGPGLRFRDWIFRLYLRDILGILSLEKLLFGVFSSLRDKNLPLLLNMHRSSFRPLCAGDSLLARALILAQENRSQILEWLERVLVFNLLQFVIKNFILFLLELHFNLFPSHHNRNEHPNLFKIISENLHFLHLFLGFRVTWNLLFILKTEKKGLNKVRFESQMEGGTKEYTGIDYFFFFLPLGFFPRRSMGKGISHSFFPDLSHLNHRQLSPAYLWA